jgi:rubrerythrin
MPMSSKEIAEVLAKALDMEYQGRLFYLECCGKTKSMQGQEMFRFLAEEEWIHYDKVEKLFRREFNKEYEIYKESNRERILDSGVFQKKVPGGSVDKSSDALDALNIGISAEEKTIRLYSRLAKGVKHEKLKKFFINLAEEEKKHHVILEKEIEAVTGTGAYTDFQEVTS